MRTPIFIVEYPTFVSLLNFGAYFLAFGIAPSILAFWRSSFVFLISAATSFFFLYNEMIILQHTRLIFLMLLISRSVQKAPKESFIFRSNMNFVNLEKSKDLGNFPIFFSVSFCFQQGALQVPINSRNLRSSPRTCFRR